MLLNKGAIDHDKFSFGGQQWPRPIRTPKSEVGQWINALQKKTSAQCFKSRS